jgi:hypothetical protein
MKRDGMYNTVRGMDQSRIDCSRWTRHMYEYVCKLESRLFLTDKNQSKCHRAPLRQTTRCQKNIFMLVTAQSNSIHLCSKIHGLYNYVDGPAAYDVIAKLQLHGFDRTEYLIIYIRFIIFYVYNIKQLNIYLCLVNNWCGFQCSCDNNTQQ